MWMGLSVRGHSWWHRSVVKMVYYCRKGERRRAGEGERPCIQILPLCEVLHTQSWLIVPSTQVGAKKALYKMSSAREETSGQCWYEVWTKASRKVS